LAKKSIDFFEHAQKILDYDGDIEFKQEGYLILATTEKEAQDFQNTSASKTAWGYLLNTSASTRR
jgi:sarcosine oxidase subunit beta